MSGRQQPLAQRERRGSYSRFFEFAPAATVAAAFAVEPARADMAACIACFERIIDDYLAANCAVDAVGAVDEVGTNSVRSQSFEACCRFQRAFEFTERMEAGLRVDELGEYSVRFGIALFPPGEDDRCRPLAAGSVVRVFIANATGKPVPLTATLRSGLLRLAAGG
ncbi:protein of unknown function [Sterolibacterium denitrificans]|uniref:Uncharacterized protein n=1 Tax=Sterolibacterium denitrificans TaxID=157592 RepID=A0A7Z7MUP9_9PROT|nr:hypothetical protein [Sterolibacterium denitrificans]SMB23502.1 protein of unknown function [Sterolibacterium denitrificans]